MENILKTLITILLPALPPDIIKKGLDSLFDTIEDAVNKSETTLDNATILPCIEWLRNQLNVPDNDEPTDKKVG